MQQNSLELLKEGKIIRFLNHRSAKVTYLQVTSKYFQCHEDYPLTPKLRRFASQAPYIIPYLKRRFSLFSRFDNGIHFDIESLYSIIPESVSLYLKTRFCKAGVKKIFEPFSGVGGIAIHLCDSFEEYVVNDYDKSKIDKLKKNLRVYNKQEHFLKYFQEDFLQIKDFETDALIICPPWGGINISKYSTDDLDSLMKPKLSSIINHGLQFSQNIMIQLPKNTNISNFIDILLQCPKVNPFFTIEKIMRNNRVQQLFFYIGNPKFTQISNHVNEVIYKDLGILSVNKKYMRKEVKEKLKYDPHKVISQIYQTVQIGKNLKSMHFEEQNTEEPPNLLENNHQ